MCRIAVVFSTRGLPLRDGFAQLEESMGGNGNGVACLDGGSWLVTKGAEMTVAECAALARHSKATLFHTRAASRGPVNDENSQPFEAAGRILAHNGHVGKQVDATATLMGIKFGSDWSDSRILTQVIGLGSGLDACAAYLAEFDGNAFVVAEGNRLGVVAAKTFYSLWRDGSCYAMASEPVKSWTGEWTAFTGIAWFDADKRTVDFSGAEVEKVEDLVKRSRPKTKYWGDDMLNKMDWGQSV